MLIVNLIILIGNVQLILEYIYFSIFFLLVNEKEKLKSQGQLKYIF